MSLKGEVEGYDRNTDKMKISRKLTENLLMMPLVLTVFCLVCTVGRSDAFDASGSYGAPGFACVSDAPGRVRTAGRAGRVCKVVGRDCNYPLHPSQHCNLIYM